MGRLREQDLPFRVKDKKVPKLVYGAAESKRKLPSEVPTVAEYDPRDNTITFFGSEKPSEYTVQHEIAHAQLGHGKSGKEPSLEQAAEEELQADLLAYSRLGGLLSDYRPSKLPPRIESRVGKVSPEVGAVILDLSTTGGDLYDRLWAWEVPNYQKWRRGLDAHSKAIRKYWQYLPASWKEAWRLYAKVGEEEIVRTRREAMRLSKVRPKKGKRRKSVRSSRQKVLVGTR